MPKQIPMPRWAHRKLEKGMLGSRIGSLTIRRILGLGNTAITYEVEDQDGFIWALKLVTRESYGDRAPFREIARFAQALDDRFLVFPKEIGDWELHYGNQKLSFIWFKSRCVHGETLEAFLKSDKAFSFRDEVRLYMEHTAAALEELSRLGFRHGDLHARNIMREIVGERGPLPEIRYVLIDFSEAHPIEDLHDGLLNDLVSYGHHLRSFSDAIYRREAISREDEKILRAIEHLPGLLNGVSVEATRLTTASEVLKRFRESVRTAEESPRKLQSPFDSLSAENITNDALLAALCFTQTRWAEDLIRPGNALLIGPRGCGKSMMFRRHRLKTKIAAEKEQEVRTDPYIGFYVPCESVFFNRISDLTEQTVDRYRDALVLFFNMAVAAEITSTLGGLPNYFGSLTLNGVNNIRHILRDEVAELWETLGFPDSSPGISSLAEHAETVMRHIRKRISYGESIASRGSIDFISRLVLLIKTEAPFLASKLFIFFLDDYTEERVPIALQQILHPIVCQRSGDLSFKISAHMFGSMYSYPQPLALDEGRNILVINLGSEYLNRDRRRAEGRALIRIMNDRFRECNGYKGTLEQWLGRTRYPGGRSLNRALNDPTTRKSVKYHGIDCLLDLCTSDFSEMIRMIGEIFHEARILPETPVHQIEAAVQDRAIRGVSREFLSRIRHIRPDGQKLYDVVNAFGELSRKLLYEKALVGQGVDRKGRHRKDPYDLLTIYVDDLTKAQPGTKRTWERLQRASIFIDIKIAPSQRTVIADRVTLRRIYCPAFATTLTSSEHLQATKAQIEYFLDRPDEFCKAYYKTETGGLLSPVLPGTEEQVEEVPDVLDLKNLPNEEKIEDFISLTPLGYAETVMKLPDLRVISSLPKENLAISLFIGAMGFEERTSGAVAALVSRDIHADKAILLEFDMYHEATAKRRETYEELIVKLTNGKPYRPLNAPVGNPDPSFAERAKQSILAALGEKERRIFFDCTSCPALILSKLIRVLLEVPCDLTILYSEASGYYPTREEWESGKLKPRGARVEGPFIGVRYVERPPSLQADDIGERPILLVLFPTFNTERTAGVMAELEPAKRIWLIGEPHDNVGNAYRIEMAKSFAAPNMYSDDSWSLLTTFDYRQTMLSLAGIISQYRFNYRTVIMPHGSKMQTLGANLFAATHQVSMVFAMPKAYSPDRYSNGCLEVWAIALGDTSNLIKELRSKRAIGNGHK